MKILFINSNCLKVCEELKIERETLKSKLGLTVPINPTGQYSTRMAIRQKSADFGVFRVLDILKSLNYMLIKFLLNQIYLPSETVFKI